MTPLTHEQIANLRALAEKATPGPWTIAQQDVLPADHGGCQPVVSLIHAGTDDAVGSLIGYERGTQDAAHIAACDPQTILALCALAAKGLTMGDDVQELFQSVAAPKDFKLWWIHYDDENVSSRDVALAAWTAALASSPPASLPDKSAQVLDSRALDALKNHQRQLDEDGVEVGVSRQALDEAIAYIESARTAPAASVGAGGAKESALNTLLELGKKGPLPPRDTGRFG